VALKLLPSWKSGKGTKIIVQITGRDGLEYSVSYHPSFQGCFGYIAIAAMNSTV
jgi:hypothetical protein